MQKLKTLTVLLFVSITMILGACATDETLNEVENTIEMKYDGEDDDESNTSTSGEDEDETNS